METRKLRAGAKACQSCRRRKVRCQYDPGMTKCRACSRRSSTCIPINAHIVTDAQQATIPQLETCIPNLEPSFDVFAGLPTPDVPTPPQPAGQHPTSLSSLAPNLESLFVPDPETADPLASWLCFSLPRSLVDRSGSSPFSVLSSEGKQWLHEAAGGEALNWDALSPFAYGPDFTLSSTSCGPRLPQQFIHLPSKEVARSLFQTYFEDLNKFCPTFEEHEFMLRFELEYPVGPESSEKWACVNATLALACLLDQQFRSKAWLFWKNATLSWGSFITQAPSLLSAQALLTMTLYLIATFHSNPASPMVSLAIRILSGIAPTGEGVSQEFQIVRLITRSLDIDHALLSGMPPTHLGLGPSIDPWTFDTFEDPNVLFDCYPAICRLIEIKEDIYRGLYCLAAQDKPDYETIITVSELDSQLDEWRNDIPEKYRPGHPKSQDVFHHGNIDNILHLHLSYYNCVLVIHRRSFLSTWSKPTRPVPPSSHAVRPPNPRVLKSTQLCAEAARATLRLAKHIPINNPLTRGVMFHYVTFALKLFVLLTVQDPRSPRARADLLLMRNLEDALASVPVFGEDRGIQKLLEYCAGYRDVAERAINQVYARKRCREDEDLGADLNSSVS
ncbi:hypothetical protein BJY04DRAFT_231241 [Aspergillus karnatakaensis]|uniref:Zn(II)2Cys6 transcription factor n=1 Tax=Aspergillus karnatakaensis TaxID=1810916 RepID=UPI003CCE1140